MLNVFLAPSFTLNCTVGLLCLFTHQRQLHSARPVLDVDAHYFVHEVQSLWNAGAFEGSEGQGLSYNAFLKWSKQLPALLTSLKSLLAAGSVDTNSTAAATSSYVGSFQHMTYLACLPLVNSATICLQESVNEPG